MINHNNFFSSANVLIFYVVKELKDSVVAHGHGILYCLRLVNVSGATARLTCAGRLDTYNTRVIQ